MIKILILMILVSDLSLAKSSFSQERLEEACIDYLRDLVSTEARITVSQRVEAQHFEEDEVQAKVVCPQTNLSGIIPVNIEFSLNNQVIRIIKSYFKINEFKLVPIATHSLKTGTTLTENDFILSKEMLTQLTIDDYIDAKDLIGKTLSKPINKNQQINKSHLTQAFLVLKGEKVKVIAESDGVNVSTLGTALNDAKEGQLVRVQRESGSQVLQGKVTSDGKIILNRK